MLRQVIASGSAMGEIYALVALGYAFVWSTMAIVNFAAGKLVTFVGFAFVGTFVIPLNLPFAAAALLVAVVMVCLGAAFTTIGARGVLGAYRCDAVGTAITKSTS